MQVLRRGGGAGAGRGGPVGPRNRPGIFVALIGNTDHRRDLALARGPAVGDEQAQRRIERVLRAGRSEEHTSELQSLMRISYAVFCLKKKKPTTTHTQTVSSIDNPSQITIYIDSVFFTTKYT